MSLWVQIYKKEPDKKKKKETEIKSQFPFSMIMIKSDLPVIVRSFSGYKTDHLF